MDGITISPREPVKACALNDQVGEHDVAHIASIEDHEGDATVGIGNHAVINGHFANTVHVAIAEFQSAGSRRKTAISDGDILARECWTPDIRGIKNNSIIASFNGAVGNPDILATVRVN